MQVKKRLQLSAAVSVLTALIILLVSFAALYRINRANTAAVIAGEIVVGALERVTLRNDYIRNNNARAKEQWFAKQEQITRRVKSAAAFFQDPGDRTAIDKLIKNNESIGKIFSAIVANREKQAAGPAGLSREVEDRLLSQLNMRVYEAVALSRNLVESSREARASAIRLAGASIIVLILLAIVAAIANSRTMSRAIASRVHRLRDGAAIIGEGNLDHRIDITGDDEFAELSEAFNAMTEKVQRSRVSLEKEVEVRTQAEKALRESEGRLQFSLETSHIGAWDLDLVDHSAFRSLEHDRIFGYTQLLPAWTFEMFLEHVMPEDRLMVQSRFQEAVATQGDWNFECRIRRADGEVRWIWAAGRHRIDETGRAGRMAGIVQDITERKKAEELRQSSAYHRSLLEASLDPLVTIDANGKITDVNEATVKATGVPRDKLIDTDFSNYFTEQEKAQAGYQQVFEKGFVTDYPLTIRNRDGRLTDVLYNASVYRNEDGKVLGVFAAARDITDIKKAQEALRESEEHYHMLFDTIDEGFCLVEVMFDKEDKPVDYRFLEINPSFEKQTGLIDARGKTMRQLAPRHEEHWFQIYGQVALSGEPIRFQNRAEQLHRWYDVYAFRFGLPKNRQVAILFNDITEKKRTEEALRSASAYNRSLLEASLDPLVTIAADGKITDVNAATEKVTGWKREELVGTDFSDYFTEPEKARTGYQRVFREGSVMDYGLEIKRKDGHITPVLYNAAVYRDESGKVVGVFAAARDITDRRKAEEEIRELNRELEARVVERTAQLENSNRELEAFAYSVSHDLRSPLRSIDGFSLALLEDYADKLDEQGRDFLARVRNATRRMSQLIDDLLRLSRVTRSDMKREKVDLSAIARTIADNLKKHHPERSAEFAIAEELTAYGDERLLTVALENLFSNAWKFSENNPATVIEFGTVKSSQVAGFEAQVSSSEPETRNPKPDTTVFFVKDNGAGFDMAYVGKLFGPFQRLHRETAFAGTGIGLATVKRIINRHGGRVWIEGAEGKGAIVYFTL